MDIFLLIGQSNMAGRGLLAEVPVIAHPHIHMFRDHHWQAAVEPLHQDKLSAGVGLAMSFAQDMVGRYPSMQIGLVPVAVGGTPLARWMSGADLYHNAVETAKKAIGTGDTLRGFLWHQGEGDSGNLTDASSYGQRLGLMIDGFRRELDAPHVPFIAGELGPFLDRLTSVREYELVNQQLHMIATMVPHYAVVSAADLKDKGDDLHFDAASLRTFGSRYAQAFCKCI